MTRKKNSNPHEWASAASDFESVQKRILQQSQKHLESLNIVDPTIQKQLIARFIKLGNTIIDYHLNRKWYPKQKLSFTAAFLA